MKSFQFGIIPKPLPQSLVASNGRAFINAHNICSRILNKTNKKRVDAHSLNVNVDVDVGIIEIVVPWHEFGNKMAQER